MEWKKYWCVYKEREHRIRKEERFDEQWKKTLKCPKGNRDIG